MIISRTPLRISFCGGGTDLPAFYQTEPGAVISTAINKYIFITVSQRFGKGIRASYSITEIVDDARQLRHELIRESLRMLGIDDGLEITSISDIPSSGTGMGSSSTYTVGLLNVLHAYQGRFASARRLASEACQIEIDVCDKPIGKQDQYIAAYGGFQFIRFNPDGTVFVDPVICNATTIHTLQRRLLLLYTGVTRPADSILKQQRDNTKKDTSSQASLRRMAGLAEEMREAMTENRLDDFGSMLHENWELKKSLANSISNDVIDDLYERVRRKGALGGKLLGAGGGGFILVYAHEEDHQRIIAAVPELQPHAFRFEPQGSKIIYVDDRY